MAIFRLRIVFKLTMKILENSSLKRYNTFGMNVSSKYLIEVDKRNLLKNFNVTNILYREPILILGGGSNILFTKNFNGIILKINLKGKEVVKEDTDYVYIRSAAGEVWHELVLYCIERGYGGIENLSLIPGCVGAAPMQNIGAYGVELKDVFHELEFFDFETGEIICFNHSACQFGYRESIFKHALKNKGVILSVTLKLHKKPTYHTSYGAINQELERMGINILSIKAISDAVCAIRRSKLPDPKQIGNAGSFFKNPVVKTGLYLKLKEKYADISGYAIGEDYTKLAAGWLIEKAGWKGKTFGEYGVHKNQALVLVNYGNAKGEEILALSQKIIEDIKEKFSVELEREVNIV